MAINFPNTPVNGSTYDFQGVRYTYKDTGGGTGLWQVTTPGTYGIASGAEIDTGTDNVKYVTPAGLEASDYLHSGEIDTAIDAKIGASIYHGPVDYSGTGSVGTAWKIGDVPSGAKTIIVDFYNLGADIAGNIDMHIEAYGGSTSIINSSFSSAQTMRALLAGSYSFSGQDRTDGRLRMVTSDSHYSWNGRLTLTHHSNFVGSYMYNVTGSLAAHNRGNYTYHGVLALSGYLRSVNLIGDATTNWDGYSSARITAIS